MQVSRWIALLDLQALPPPRLAAKKSQGSGRSKGGGR